MATLFLYCAYKMEIGKNVQTLARKPIPSVYLTEGNTYLAICIPGVSSFFPLFPDASMYIFIGVYYYGPSVLVVN